MSLIIIEGVDGSGKTTLMDSIAKQWDDTAQEFHCGPIKDHPLREYVRPLRNYDPSTQNIVADRWHLGELVYGPLYRGSSAIDGVMLDFIEMFLDSRGAHRMIMTTPYEVVMKRIADRGEDFVRPSDMRLIHDFYTGMVGTRGWVGKKSPVSAISVKNIIKAAEEKAEIVASLDKTYVGAPDAKYVIHLKREDHLPFAGMPASRTSEGYMLLAAARMVEGFHGNFAMTYEKGPTSNPKARHLSLGPDFFENGGAAGAALRLEKVLR